mgnify:CR=1 FL=1
MRSFLRDRGGASAVEFAVLVGPFLLLLLGGVEFARLAWTRQALQETAISAARCMGVLATGCAASGAYSASGTQTYVTNRASGVGLTVPVANMTLNRAATCAGVANFSSVTLTYTFQTVAPALVKALAGGTVLTATACFPNNV